VNRNYYVNKLSASRLERVYDIAGPRVCQYLQAEIDHVSRFVNPGDRILELGCGYGRVLEPLARIAAQTWGVDNSMESLQLLRSRQPDSLLVAMDAAHLAFKLHRFDLVLGVQNFISVCNVPPQKVLMACLQVARPGGWILLSSYAAQFWPHRLAWFRRQAEEGLLGPIDENATGGGVVVCQDGFRAATFSPQRFHKLALSCDVRANVYSVDDSSVFCEIRVPDE
jgi:2-polyprenyl-6-hydroxyphenyl methylase/3-demethylubiquinone-9 3-methyltransferase